MNPGLQEADDHLEALHYLELLEVSRLLHSGQLSPVALTAAMIRRVEALNPRVKSFVRLWVDEALEAAQAAEAEIQRGSIRGPLHGVPLAWKDMFWVKGAPTAAGMEIHREFVSDEDATVIRRLREAGAILLGQLVLTEGVHAEHRPPYEAPMNPWREDHWSGASSSGSGVSVAAGLCFAALSSETGGSTRLPSAVNGVTGIKPSWGRVSRHGVFELAGSLDHVGVIARSVGDAAAVLGAIAGPDSRDPTAASHPVPDYLKEMRADVRGTRIGLDYSWTHSTVDSETARAFDDALDVLGGLGVEIVPVEMPGSAETMIWDWMGICAVETALAHEKTFPSRASEYGPALTRLIEQGRALSGMEHQRLCVRRENFRRDMENIFKDVDCLAMPVLGFAPPTIERMANIDDDAIRALHRFTCPFNMSGNPALVLPCGKNSASMPLVFQLVGPRFSEAMLFAVGHTFQASTHWHQSHPFN